MPPKLSSSAAEVIADGIKAINIRLDGFNSTLQQLVAESGATKEWRAAQTLQQEKTWKFSETLDERIRLVERDKAGQERVLALEQKTGERLETLENKLQKDLSDCIRRLEDGFNAAFSRIEAAVTSQNKNALEGDSRLKEELEKKIESQASQITNLTNEVVTLQKGEVRSNILWHVATWLAGLVCSGLIHQLVK